MPWLLNLVYAAFLVAASPWLLYRAITTGRYREGWSQKLLGSVPRSVTKDLGGKPVVWLHGVSVGEVQLLKPLLEQLRQKNPETCFVVSTSTQSGMDLAKKLYPSASLFYLPFDFTWAVQRALARIQPQLLVLGELELWPNLIGCATKQNVPIAVVNARLSERSFRGYQRFGWLTKSMFQKLHLVAAQDPTYADRFIRCGVPSERVKVTGSTKFDNVTFDRHNEHVEQLGKLVGLDTSHHVWIVGSTQSPEEAAACRAFIELKDSHPNLRLIVVPRHPERFDEVYRELEALEVHPLRRSLIGESGVTKDWQVLLVDTVGELRWWWGLADTAIVGGSFGSRGGQNMIEPAAYGANVAFGPNTSNFKDISEMLLDGGGAQRIEGLEQILPWMREQLIRPELGKQRGQKAQELVKKHQGALSKTVEELQAIIDRPQTSPSPK